MGNYCPLRCRQPFTFQFLCIWGESQNVTTQWHVTSQNVTTQWHVTVRLRVKYFIQPTSIVCFFTELNIDNIVTWRCTELECTFWTCRLSTTLVLGTYNKNNFFTYPLNSLAVVLSCRKVRVQTSRRLRQRETLFSNGRTEYVLLVLVFHGDSSEMSILFWDDGAVLERSVFAVFLCNLLSSLALKMPIS
jgi:hypothetical protein